MIGPKYLLGEAIPAQTSLMNDNAAFFADGHKVTYQGPRTGVRSDDIKRCTSGPN